MKRFILSFLALFTGLTAFGQVPPLLRTQFTTNAAGVITGTTPADGEFLIYSTAASRWTNAVGGAVASTNVTIWVDGVGLVNPNFQSGLTVSNTVSGTNFTMAVKTNSITGAMIVADTITGADIASGAVAWDELADPSVSWTDAWGTNALIITSTIDGDRILRLYNNDADAAAPTGFIDLRHDDVDDADIWYLRGVGDGDGTPTLDYELGQTALLVRSAITTRLSGPVNIGGAVVATNSVTALSFVAGATNVVGALAGKQPSFTTGAGVTNIANVLSGNYTAGVNITLVTNANGAVEIQATAGSGGAPANTIVGPGGTTDNSIPRMNGTSGTNIQSSPIIMSDAGALTGIDSITTTNGITASSFNAVGSGAGAETLWDTDASHHWRVVPASVTGTNINEIKPDQPTTGFYYWTVSAVTNATASIIDSITAAHLGADSVSASELNAAGVTNELAAILNLQDLQGALPFNKLTDLTGSANIAMGNNNVQISHGGSGNWSHTYQGTSGGHLFEVEHNAGNQPAGTHLLHVGEAAGDLDVLPIHAFHSGDAASVELLRIEGDRATMADNDEVLLTGRLSDSAGTQTTFSQVAFAAADTDNGGEDGAVILSALGAGVMTEVARFDTNGLLVTGRINEGANAVPNATDHLGFFAATTSAQLAGVLSNETGSGGAGVAVFSEAPTIGTPHIGSSGTDNTGVQIYGSNGTLAFFGEGDGQDEHFQMDFNGTANTVVFTTASAATLWYWPAINLQASNIVGTINGSATGTTLRQIETVYFSHPHRASGTGATMSTNNTASKSFGRVTFDGAGGPPTSTFAEWDWVVPSDIYTNTAVTARLKVKTSGTDNGATSWRFLLLSVADSANAESTSFTDTVAFEITPSSAAAGDAFTSSEITLTNWSGQLIPNNFAVIQLQRLTNGSSSNVDDFTELGLVLRYDTTR